MMEIIKELPKLLENYFVYIYPGFLTIYIYNFAKARETKLDKTTLIMSIVISYTYILIYGFIFSTSILNFHDVDYVALFIAADFIPLMWYRASRSAWGGQLLKRLGINTSLEDTAWDYIHCQDKKGEGISLKVFLDDKNIMYEGSLRYREANPEKSQVICLSGYRRYVKEEKRYSPQQDYNKDNSRWVLINIEDITRAEIKYKSGK